MIKISVIVTIHNAQDYLEECLDSIINQTFSQIEILCIDGGSSDKTPEILQQYKKQDERVRIINDSNTSYGHKVNRGIREAKGVYISVVESDDYYDLNMLSKLYEIAVKFDTDIVNASYYEFFDVNNCRFHKKINMYDIKDYNCLIDYASTWGVVGNITRYWTGLFKKEFLDTNRIRMNESPGASYQDMSFRFLTSVMAKRVYHLDQGLYWYRVDNMSSSMHDSAKTIMIADEHDFLWSELEKRGIDDAVVLHQALEWKYRDFFGNMTYINKEGVNRNNLFARYQYELNKDNEVLKKYRLEGYDSIATFLIDKDKESVLNYIRTESQKNTCEKEKIFELLSMITRLKKDCAVVLFGIGNRGRGLIEYLSPILGDNLYLMDNSDELQGAFGNRYKIYKPIELVPKCEADTQYIIVSRNGEEMKKELTNMGVLKNQIYVF